MFECRISGEVVEVLRRTNGMVQYRCDGGIVLWHSEELFEKMFSQKLYN